MGLVVVVVGAVGVSVCKEVKGQESRKYVLHVRIPCPRLFPDSNLYTGRLTYSRLELI